MGLDQLPTAPILPHPGTGESCFNSVRQPETTPSSMSAPRRHHGRRRRTAALRPAALATPSRHSVARGTSRHRAQDLTVPASPGPIRSCSRRTSRHARDSATCCFLTQGRGHEPGSASRPPHPNERKLQCAPGGPITRESAGAEVPQRHLRPASPPRPPAGQRSGPRPTTGLVHLTPIAARSGRT